MVYLALFMLVVFNNQAQHAKEKQNTFQESGNHSEEKAVKMIEADQS